MDGAVERSGKSGQANDLAEGAGETVPLKANENFEERPHQTAHTGRTEVGTAPGWHDYADDLDNEGYDDEDDWLDQECALGDDGQCGLAGTEHCDFSCPNRDSEDFCGSAAWRRKHGEAV